MGKAVFCITNSAFQAEAVVNELKVGGFAGGDISVVFPDKSERGSRREQNKKGSAGVAVKGGTGIGTGDALGWLAGIRVLAIPGAGPFIATGPVADALHGAAVGSTTTGIAEALIGMGISDTRARNYETQLKSGRILIALHTSDPEAMAQGKAIFESRSTSDISSTGEAPRRQNAKK